MDVERVGQNKNKRFRSVGLPTNPANTLDDPQN